MPLSFRPRLLYFLMCLFLREGGCYFCKLDFRREDLVVVCVGVYVFVCVLCVCVVCVCCVCESVLCVVCVCCVGVCCVVGFVMAI